MQRLCHLHWLYLPWLLFLLFLLSLLSFPPIPSTSVLLLWPYLIYHSPLMQWWPLFTDYVNVKICHAVVSITQNWQGNENSYHCPKEPSHWTFKKPLSLHIQILTYTFLCMRMLIYNTVKWHFHFLCHIPGWTMLFKLHPSNEVEQW